MNLDLRVPLGWMFTLAGLILTVLGLKTNDDAALYTRSLGINANLWWGLVLLAFGLAMFFGSRRGQKQAEKNRLAPSKSPKVLRKR